MESTKLAPRDKPKLGIIGWRGMVGSVLLERMKCEADFNYFQTTFYSSSQAGSAAPAIDDNTGKNAGNLLSNPTIGDAYDYSDLSKLDIILTTQGGSYSEKVLPKLRHMGWQGYWIDAASTFRMHPNTKIVLDPINRADLLTAISQGIKTFAGANCSTATLLLGLAGLFQASLIETLSFMSYQSISGAGAQAMKELIAQHDYISKNQSAHAHHTHSAIEQEKNLTQALHDENFPKTSLSVPLATNILPWIDSDLGTGSSREELKTMDETNKILSIAAHKRIPIDGTCVRVGVLRSHSFGCTIRLRKNLAIAEIEQIIAGAHPWVKLIPNTKEATLRHLTPIACAKTLDIHVGRLRKTRIDAYTINAFVIADQLLWGAAEPLRRMLHLILERYAHEPTLFNNENALIKK
ncbi:aspartate-semialdehyde dehydrogenase [Spirochaetota bacterium]|nr:aspartate-semialdehyde dehydrogenase [Spirochaetota bacterium]